MNPCFDNFQIAQIRIRRDIRKNWEDANPILALGEFSVVLDEYPTPLRIGDGVHYWTQLREQYLSLDSDGFTLSGVADLNTIPQDTLGFWIASKQGTYSGFDNLSVPLGKVYLFVYSGDKWISLDTGIFSYEGAKHLKEAYYNPPIIGENGNWWLWNADKGAFEDTHIPSQGRPGCPGQDAGFGAITAELNYIKEGEDPSVEVETSGPNCAKNIHFIFNLPAGTEIKSYISFENKHLTFDADGVPQHLVIWSNDRWTLRAEYNG